MTDDIVTRLRGAGSWLITGEWTHDSLCREAADEIERLRSMIRHVLGNNAFDPDDDCSQCSQIMGRYGNIIWHTPIPDSAQDKARPVIVQQRAVRGE